MIGKLLLKLRGVDMSVREIRVIQGLIAVITTLKYGFIPSTLEGIAISILAGITLGVLELIRGMK